MTEKISQLIGWNKSISAATIVIDRHTDIEANKNNNNTNNNTNNNNNNNNDSYSLFSWFSNADKQENTYIPSLSRKQRILGFLLCITLGIICFILAALLIPLILIKARRFAVLFTLGSISTLGAFSFLWGPSTHIQHMISLDRLPFTISYILTLILTLVSALYIHSTILTILFGILQVLALLWYVCGYVPGGLTGISLMSKVFGSAVTNTNI